MAARTHDDWLSLRESLPVAVGSTQVSRTTTRSIRKNFRRSLGGSLPPSLSLSIGGERTNRSDPPAHGGESRLHSFLFRPTVRVDDRKCNSHERSPMQLYTGRIHTTDAPLPPAPPIALSALEMSATRRRPGRGKKNDRIFRLLVDLVAVSRHE